MYFSESKREVTVTKTAYKDTRYVSVICESVYKSCTCYIKNLRAIVQSQYGISLHTLYFALYCTSAYLFVGAVARNVNVTLRGTYGHATKFCHGQSYS